jgi:phosphatidylglycerophosphatase A
MALALAETDPRHIDMALAILGLSFGIGCLVWGQRAEGKYGKKDPGAVVADEIAGQSLALMWLPWSTTNSARVIATCAIAFFMFRIFDIIKPPPARGWQRLEGGLGILIDDLVAGLYALIATQLIVRNLW